MLTLSSKDGDRDGSGSNNSSTTVVNARTAAAKRITFGYS